ncbi:hypothetical protein B0T13DRAFT_169594 [Neurospora crassa]|nr:hypothetical protein B0T13DRAFT_169594 [Neurospora crassa]
MAPEQKSDISIRQSIRWIPSSSPSSSSDTPPPSEPTSTIVLTSPSGRFVDLRIFKEDPSSPNHTSVFIHPHSYTGSETEAKEAKTLPLSRLDWAIAGTSTHTSTRPTIGYYGQKLILPDGRTVNGTTADLKSGKHPYMRGRWTHWVDSRVLHAEEKISAEAGDNGSSTDEAAADEGDMYRIPGEGNEKLALEKGKMVNPESGQEEEYEEVWVPDEEGVAEPSHVNCIVWELDDKLKNKKGRVVKVGRWAQGILRRGNELLCERWKWVGGENEQSGWRLEARVKGYVGGEEKRKVDEKDGSYLDEPLVFPRALIDNMISVGEAGNTKEVGDAVKESNGDVWTLVEWCP